VLSSFIVLVMVFMPLSIAFLAYERNGGSDTVWGIKIMGIPYLALPVAFFSTSSSKLGADFQLCWFGKDTPFGLWKDRSNGIR